MIFVRPSGMELDFPSVIVFFFFVFFFYRIRELWEENVIVGKANGAEICLKTGTSSDTCMLLYKCIYTLTIVTSNAVLCTKRYLEYGLCVCTGR